MAKAKTEESKLVKVKGKKAKAGKPQHLEVGKTYEVTPELAKQLKANGQAE